MSNLALIRVYNNIPIKSRGLTVIPLESIPNNIGKTMHWKTKWGSEQFICAGNIQEIMLRIRSIHLGEKKMQCL